MTGFVAGDVTVTGGTAAGFTQIDQKTFRFTVTPSGTGLVTVAVAAGVATDGAGNQNTAAPTFTSTPTRTTAGMVATTSPPQRKQPRVAAPGHPGAKGLGRATGTGPAVTSASTLGVFYTGWLTNGTVFDSSRTDDSPSSFALSGLIQGWKQGLIGMQLGGIRRLYVPAALGYGSAGRGASRRTPT